MFFCRTKDKKKGQFSRNLFFMYGEKLLDTARNTGLDATKTASKKLVHKAIEATGEFIGNKIAEKIVKRDADLKIVEEINVPPEKREEILNELRKVI